MADAQLGEPSKRQTLVEWKLPLPWILGVVGIFAAAAVSLIFQVTAQGETLKDMKDQLKDVKVSITNNNSQSIALAGEIAIMKFRVENLERSRRPPRIPPP